MNMPQVLTLDLISASQIKQAKLQAQLQQRRVIEVLEELTGDAQEPFLQRLSTTLHYSAISMKELHSMVTAFEVIPFATAQQKECLAFYKNTDYADTQHNKVLTLVFADPFNESLQEWALEVVKQPCTWRLAHSSDIAAFLAKHEETMRAMDGLHDGGHGTSADTDAAVANLSLKSINEDTNPIIKLINSTL